MGSVLLQLFSPRRAALKAAEVWVQDLSKIIDRESEDDRDRTIAKLTTYSSARTFILLDTATAHLGTISRGVWAVALLLVLNLFKGF